MPNLVDKTKSLKSIFRISNSLKSCLSEFFLKKNK